MNRSIPVANKTCAARARSRQHEQHRQRVQKVRPLVDTTLPATAQLDHLRNNLKGEQLLEERYREIDRENRILLQKMSDVMRQQPTPTTTPRTARGPSSLNTSARKTELMRITQENFAILKRIQQAQPVYNHIQWEDAYKKNFDYLKNAAEYPIALGRQGQPSQATSPQGGAGPGASSLSEIQQASLSLGGGASGSGSRPNTDRPLDSARGAGGPIHSEELRYVFKEGKRIGERFYLVEMATDGWTLTACAYHGDTQQTLELVVNERNHRKLYRECRGDYALIADRLGVEGEQLFVDTGSGSRITGSG